ncbi:hypothetical protein B0H17DRAFT_1216899 [Mycena rosella]|uniref:Uncharacterized protein n=1 Tax=Mycena rosella TaxID=1033263 RepID=A0AAD7C318_MYCRO|nr:hypothetical protein B0H17DRAFT_1216899 [Mycena rosella]
MSTTMTATNTSTARAPSSPTTASSTSTPNIATTATATTPTRPRMLTESYSLRLWRKQRPQREEEQEHVVLKVALPRIWVASSASSHPPPPPTRPRFSRRHLGINTERYAEPEPVLDLDGKSEVDLAASLER